ncbi:hypothetical protein BKA70DRAFT_1454641 [Coprinopsis sp. MPI-PUGE-AT-0042]|nr:hypothetical protein BKA70DRAFT_1454641 [Coprinopsis sp. MPI-PUGE-AT-0042]
MMSSATSGSSTSSRTRGILPVAGSHRQPYGRKLLTPHGHFLRRIQAAHFKTRNSAPTILHWSPRKKDLEVWYWPTDVDGQRIAPSELEAHRRTHEFRSPCCLCAADGTHPSGFESSYTEAQIGIVTKLPNEGLQSEYGCYALTGEYVAICAQRRCGYLVCLEWFYALPLLFVRKHEERENPLPQQELTYIDNLGLSEEGSEDAGLFQTLPQTLNTRGTKRKLQNANFDSLDDLPNQIEALIRDGVPESVFWSMFIQCSACKIITATSVFAHLHDCPHRRRYDQSVRELQAYAQAKRRRVSTWQTQVVAAEHNSNTGGPSANSVLSGASEIDISDSESSSNSMPGTQFEAITEEQLEAEIPTDVDSD